jgi:MFS family permease
MPAVSNQTRRPEWQITLLAALSAFCVYTCMYAFRKPFTAASFDKYTWWGINFKIWLVIAQTAGYTVSKFFGIGFIGGMKNDKRATSIIKLIGIAWIALFFFAVFPPPYNIIFILINGFPLGIIYGLVFSYLEGRRTTELLGAVLATSFIFASGFTQSAGKFVMLEWKVSEWWMPWMTGLLFFLPLLLFTWLLQKTPPPNEQDIRERTERLPMTKKERKNFLQTFMPGLIMLITAYVMLTIIRDYRSNFASDIWKELGYGKEAAVFTKSELPASLIVLLLMSGLVLIRKNIYALLVNHIVIIMGFGVAMGSTLLFMQGGLSSFWWMTLTGVGLYMGYVPFNCMLFERLIASFKYVSNAGFIIYVADSFGYLGSDVILLVKNFMHLQLSWTEFFINMVLVVSAAGIILVILSAVYFQKKYRDYFPIATTKLNYG